MNETMHASTAQTAIAIRAQSRQSAGSDSYPSFGEFQMLYGYADRYTVADLEDYLSVFSCEVQA